MINFSSHNIQTIHRAEYFPSGQISHNNASANWLWAVFHDSHGKEDNFKFYDDLNTMLLALNRGEIDEIDLPEVVGEYVTAQNSDYEDKRVDKG